MRRRRLLFTILLVIASAAGLRAQSANPRSLPDNYVSDKCSWFPDGDYSDCCVVHDEAYFFGGTKQERSAADKKLYECVKGKGRGLTAKMMWIGVRVGGVAFLPTPFRWGFGRDWARKHPATK